MQERPTARLALQHELHNRLAAALIALVMLAACGVRNRAVAAPADIRCDYTDDGICDAADYTVWRDTLGQIGFGLAADGVADDVIDQADYDYWKQNFGTSAAGSGAAPAVPCDFNVNGVCDAADYTLWRDHFGDPTEAGINYNGDGGGVTISDYHVWKTNFGTSAGSGGGALAAPVSGQALPEPTAAVLFLGGSLLHSGRRLRRDGHQPSVASNSA